MPLFVENFGNTITVTFSNCGSAVSIAAATTKQLHFKKPGGDTASKTASFVSGSGTDGKARYTIEDGFLDEDGTWQVQGFVSGSGFQWTTEWGSFTVKNNIIV